MRPCRRRSVYVCVAVLLLSLASLAQTIEKGAISGTVTDPSGAVVPNATVKITHVGTGETRTATTDSGGNYSASTLSVGEYSIEVSAPNFGTTRVKNLQLAVGQRFIQDVSLKVTAVGEVVEVTSDTGPIDRGDTRTKTTIGNEYVDKLPISGRDFRDFAALGGTADTSPGLRSPVRLGGQQGEFTGLLIDGVDNRNSFFGEWFGSLETKNFTIPQDSVQEFQVRDSGLSAELGHSAGGLINVVTKSGTNDWHGTAHWFVQSNSFYKDNATLVDDPSNPDPTVLIPAPPPFDTRNQFGGTVGGPIVREKLFFFLAADLQEQAGPLGTSFLQDVSAVATPEFGGGFLSDLAGSVNQRQDLRTALFKLDYQITSGTRGTSRVNYTRNETDNFTGGRSQIFVGDAVSSNFENFVNEGPVFLQTITHVFNPTTVNEARFAYSLERRDRINNGAGPEVNITDLPAPGQQGVGTFGRRFFLPITSHHKRIQVVDNFSKTFGKHDIKLGVDLNSNGTNQAFIGFAGGVYNFEGLANFQNTGNLVCPLPATRCPSSYRQLFGINGFGQVESGTLETFWQHERSLYIQDDWKIHPRVTLNLGLRWDGIWNPDPQFPILGTQVALGRPRIENGVLTQAVGPPPQGIPDDLDNIAPRIGVSWDATGDGKTIVRGGFGIYYAAPATIYLASILSGTGFRGADTSIPFNTATGMDTLGLGLTYPNTLPTELDPAVPAELAILQILSPPNIVFADPELESVRVMNFQVGVEREIVPNISVSGTYVHNRSENLRTGGFNSAPWDRTLDPAGVTFDSVGRTVGRFSIPRLPQSIDPITGNPVIGGANVVASFGRGRYHAFIFQLKSGAAKNYQFQVNYTLSFNRDNATTDRDTDAFFGPSDPFNLELDYGTSQLDIRNQFRAFASFTLPAKIELSTIFNARTGRAFPVYGGFCVPPFPNAEFTDGFQCANFFLSQIRPAATAGGVVERFPFRNHGFFNWDVRVGRTFNLGSERVRLRPSLEIFNLTNRNNAFSTTTGFTINGMFCGGLSTEALCQFNIGAGPEARDNPTLPLSMQLGLKLIF